MNKHNKLSSKDNLWKTCLLIIYSILLGIAAAKHEPWFDEAQAWLLARDASFVELMVKYLRYEGSPGLWHVILMIPAQLGLPYITVNIISALLALAGAYLFLFYSPFPIAIKILYPFSYFAFYQYGVVARSYSLIPALLFTIAIIYRDKSNKPILFACLLILLANVSFHGVIIASSLALILTFQVLGKWSAMKKSTRYGNLVSIMLFGLVIFLLKLQLELPKDIISVAGFKKEITGIFQKCMPLLYNAISVSDAPNLPKYDLAGILSRIFSIITLVLTLFWFTLRKKLMLFVIPAAGLFILFTMVYANAWHTGILFYTWLFVLWISYAEVEIESNKLTDNTRAIITYALTAVLFIQSCWSVNSFKYDYTNNYSASREAARYIKEANLENKNIYATNFHSISILPYFDSNLFCNYNNKTQPSFWIWSHQNSMYTDPYLATDKYSPDIVILGLKSYSPNYAYIDSPFLPDIPGYSFARLFSGALYWKNGLLETDSFAFYKKDN